MILAIWRPYFDSLYEWHSIFDWINHLFKCVFLKNVFHFTFHCELWATFAIILTPSCVMNCPVLQAWTRQGGNNSNCQKSSAGIWPSGQQFKTWMDTLHPGVHSNAPTLCYVSENIAMPDTPQRSSLHPFSCQRYPTGWAASAHFCLATCLQCLLFMLSFYMHSSIF